MALSPLTEAAFLQNTLKSGKWLELGSTDDPDLQGHFPSTSKGIQHDPQEYKVDQICTRQGV